MDVLISRLFEASQSMLALFLPWNPLLAAARSTSRSGGTLVRPAVVVVILHSDTLTRSTREDV